MRQVRIRVTCDACQAWHDSENEKGVETVPVAGGQTLDLCPSHRDDLAPFLALVAEWGVTPERVSKRRGASAPAAPTSAPVAPAEAERVPNRRGGKRARARRANAEQQQAPDTAPVVSEGLPLVCPMCGHSSPNAAALGVHVGAQHQTNLTTLYGGTCPLCNHQGDPRGLGTHAVRAHQLTSAAELFAIAHSQGDPHGVIAARALAVAQQ